MNKIGRYIVLIMSGILIGAVNGFLGAGGGILTVIVLRYVLKLEPKEAHATAIFVILPLCAVSGIIYVILGHFSLSISLFVLIGSLVGAVLGTVILSKLKNNIIVYIFGVVIILSGVKLIF
ncbi:MAG: sulfite exporter TauE/SafE family protein [Clostridia bacterium]|nr:sulfite exporter TauE/SafE family protein [Clostridia bacterium]